MRIVVVSDVESLQDIFHLGFMMRIRVFGGNFDGIFFGWFSIGGERERQREGNLGEERGRDRKRLRWRRVKE